MVEKTVEVGDTEVQIEETDDGFEVTEVEPDPNTAEKFTSDTGISERHSLGFGNVDNISTISGGGVRLDVNNESYDEFHSDDMRRINDSPWEVVEIDFDHGHINFRDTDA